MKNKIKNILGKTAAFVKDHTEEITLGVYSAFMVVIIGQSINGLRLANQKTRLELQALQQK